LREARRKQLAIERDSIQAQLRILDNTRTRLETALAEAQGRAYQEKRTAGGAHSGTGCPVALERSLVGLWSARFECAGGFGGTGVLPESDQIALDILELGTWFFVLCFKQSKHKVQSTKFKAQSSKHKALSTKNVGPWC
jgi:hypothetical protein